MYEKALDRSISGLFSCVSEHVRLCMCNVHAHVGPMSVLMTACVKVHICVGV